MVGIGQTGTCLPCHSTVCGGSIMGAIVVELFGKCFVINTIGVQKRVQLATSHCIHPAHLYTPHSPLRLFLGAYLYHLHYIYMIMITRTANLIKSCLLDTPGKRQSQWRCPTYPTTDIISSLDHDVSPLCISRRCVSLGGGAHCIVVGPPTLPADQNSCNMKMNDVSQMSDGISNVVIVKTRYVRAKRIPLIPDARL